jgi:pimeloyl-ACP methyl ester carboxylesterase
MKKFLKGTFITAAVLAVIGGIAYHFINGLSPRDTVTSYTGVKVDVEPMSFYRGGDKISGRIYRPVLENADRIPVVIYCQNISYGEHWCKDLAGKGFLCYCFDFAGDGEKARIADLGAVVKNIGEQRCADPGHIYLLGESNGCKTASLTFFDHPKQIAGLILISPGFNPLELSRKARRFKGDILVVDGAQAKWNAATEIADYIRR